MAVSRWRSRRKSSGGLYKHTRKKYREELHREPTLTGLGKRKLRTLRARGGHVKHATLRADVVNVYDPQAKKHFTAKIETVVESPSDPNFVRRNIMTKGTVVKTDKGMARITSRPGQEGTVNAVLIGK